MLAVGCRNTRSPRSALLQDFATTTKFFALWQRSKKKGGFATLDVFSAAGAASHFALRFERQLHFAHLNIINVFSPPLLPKNTHTISFASLIASTTCL
jgi:hypothetical protein